MISVAQASKGCRKPSEYQNLKCHKTQSCVFEIPAEIVQGELEISQFDALVPAGFGIPSWDIE